MMCAWGLNAVWVVLQICTEIEALELEQAQAESSISRFFRQSRPAAAQAAPQAAGA